MVNPTRRPNRSGDEGRKAARQSVGGGGRGSWRKRRPACNGRDRGSNFAPAERQQTSTWCNRR
ncbi:MAG: hypothetical protein E2602_15985 [Achromobacter sp.]|nr:hypothetical protein [Achromobacter sp.]QCS61194.1 hypothetical protein EC609_00280 [Achromobacter denitrificans]